MPHLGTQPPTGFKTTTKQSFSGDNSTVAFTLNRASSSSTDLEIFVDNIQQEPTTAYSVSGTTLTFTEAPPTGTNNVYVVNRGGDQNGLLPPQDLGTTDYIFGDDISLNSDGAVVNMGADSEIKITHVADTGIKLTDSGGSPTLQLHDANESVSSDGSNLILTSGGTAFTLPTSDGTSGQALVTNASGVLSFATAGSNTPSSADGQALGSASLEWSDLFLADGGQILFGNDQEITLTHVADSGLTLKHAATADDKFPTLTLAAGDNDIAASDKLGVINFVAPDEGTGTDAILVAAGIEAVSEGDFSSSSNATKLVFKTGASEAAAEKMSIASTGATTITTTGNEDSLTLESTDADANAGPKLILYRNSSSPADDDNIGAIRFRGRNDNSQDVDYAEIESFIVDASDSTENGGLAFKIIQAGTSNEMMRIDGSRQLHIGSTTAVTGSTRVSIHQQNNQDVLQLENTHASFSDRVMIMNAHRAANSAYQYLLAYSGDFADLEFNLRGDGNAYADQSWNADGADYAEYFEWKDGNTSDEDRVGISVKLDGDKIVASSDSDNASDIIGVISANPSITGDSAWNKWNQKHLKDDYGRYIWEEYTTTEWNEEVNGANQPVSYETDKIPSDVTVPSDAKVVSEDSTGAKLTRRKLNPDWDESKTYIAREDRKEWDTVGLMGKLRMKKGQKTGTNWIKMRDVSDTVEEWLVR